MWYEVTDLSTPAGSFTGGGLFFRNGQAKPSAAAFGFPFVALRSGHRSFTFWGRARRGGPVAIEALRGGHWRRVLRLHAGRAGVFFANRRVKAALALRARQGGALSYPWPAG
jgi:hypothetical protein